MSPLAVALDVSAVPEHPAGAGRYTIEVARALAEQDELALSLLSRRSDTARWSALGADRVVPIVPDGRVGRLAYERWRMGRTVDRLGVAVHHAPHYTMPGAMATPAVVTIHDVTFFEHPEVHEAAKVRFFTAAIRRAASQAGALICVSQRTADRLGRHVEVSVPVVVAPHGIDHLRFAPTESTPGADAAVLAGLALDANVQRILCLGTLEPRKGISSLVGAFSALASEDPAIELVFAGQRGWGTEEIDRLCAASPFSARIRMLGYVADEAVPALLRTAAVVAYPSLDEGFGLPALEALACGARLVTTSGSVMEEICGLAPWLCDPADRASLESALRSALSAGVDEVARRRHLGETTASQFTWEASASRHLEAYHLAADRSW